MGCGTSFVKYVLFFFNLVVSLLGLALIGIGVAFQLNWKEFKELLKDQLTVAPWVFIVIGAIMFFIAFLGCCGAIRESHCMVVSYAIFLLIIIILQVVIGILLFVYEEDIKSGITTALEGLFRKRTTADTDPATQAIINNIQQQFTCCGEKGGYEYGLILDDSCCTRTGPIGYVVGGRCTAEVANPGCVQTITSLYQKWSKPMAGAAIGIACIEVVGALFALCLANSIRNMDRRYG